VLLCVVFRIYSKDWFSVHSKLPLECQNLFAHVGHVDQVTCLYLDAEAREIVSGAKDKSLRVWDIDTEECLFTVQ